jgi:type II secretion system protein D
MVAYIWQAARRGVGCALALGLLLAVNSLALAQRTGNVDFQVYNLQHARAGELEPQLAHLLSAVGGPTEVVADAARNRILVRGPAEAQALVRQTLATLDRPAAAAQTAPLLRTYPAHPSELDQLTAALRARYPEDLGVRVAPDKRQAMLLVLAPAAVHDELAQFLGVEGTAADAQPAPQAAGPAARSLAVSVGSGQLVRIVSPWEKLQTALQQLLGERLIPSPVDGSPLSIYTIAYNPQLQVRLQYDPRAQQVAILGPADAVGRTARLLTALDRPQDAFGETRVVPIRHARPAKILQAVGLVQDAQSQGPAGAAGGGVESPGAAGDDAANSHNFVSMLFRQRGTQRGTPATQLAWQQPGAAQPGGAQGGADAAQPGAQPQPGEGGAGLIGQVQVEVLEGLGIIILRGRKSDVEQVRRLIEEIERTSVETEPLIEVYHLRHVNSEALGSIVTTLYDSVYSARTGRISITALVKPNALLLIGQPASVAAALKLIKRLDVPASPDAQFEVFRLRHAAANTVQTTVTQLFAAPQGQQTPPGLATRVLVVADFRTNSLIVRASRRDLAEVAHLISQIDQAETPSELVLRIFQLQNAEAADLASVLQAAITGQVTAQPGAQPAAQPPGQQQQQQQRSTMLRLMTLDARDRRLLRSGILTDVQVTADARANALLVKAPEESMELIASLVEELDRIPGAVSQIKVFTILNGDAQSLVEMLQALFGQAAQQAGGGLFGGAQQPAAAIAGQSTLVPLRFAVDTRTNSIIASGAPADLTIVEAILIRLDESDVRERKTQVYRLRNAPALDVSDAINLMLQSERELQAVGPRSAFQQIQEEVIVVPEPVTNSLIVTSTPRYFDEIRKVIEQLDEKPPLVMIQVLIARVQLNNTDEFGVELGLQDSILFDRSLLGDLVTTTDTTEVNVGGAVQTVTDQIIQGASLTPGYAFNNAPLGNSGSDLSRGRRREAGQALTSFSLGRTNGELGYGGLVLSMSGANVSILLRALQECRRLDVLSRPQIMTMDNQPAFVQVGQRVSLISATSFDPTTQIQTNTLGTPQNVGLILGVTPRISPDGLVAMEIDIEQSEVGPEEEGIPISISTTGQVVRSPRINTTLAQTTVNATNGQTIVLGGLISRIKEVTHRRIPLVASVPVLGHLFRYDSEVQRREELLIIMTPRVVRDEADAELIKRVESARMSWVLSDVRKMHGEAGLASRLEPWAAENNLTVIYPDENPRGIVPPPGEELPRPSGSRSPDRVPPGVLPPANDSPAAPPPPEPGSASLRRRRGQAADRTAAGDHPLRQAGGAFRQAAPPAGPQPNMPAPLDPPPSDSADANEPAVWPRRAAESAARSGPPAASRDAAGAGAVAHAPELLQPEFARRPPSQRGEAAQAMQPAAPRSRARFVPRDAAEAAPAEAPSARFIDSQGQLPLRAESRLRFPAPEIPGGEYEREMTAE